MKKDYTNKQVTGYDNKTFYYPKRGVTITAKSKEEADKKLLATNKDKANAETNKGGGSKGDK